MSCGFLSEAQVCDEPYRSFNHWSVCMVMYTNPVVRARLVAQPVSMLEARPTRGSCAALFLILVKTNWNGLSVSRGSQGALIIMPILSFYPYWHNELRPKLMKGV